MFAKIVCGNHNVNLISTEVKTMRDFVHWLLSEENSDEIATLFGFWHFFYLFIIAAFCTAMVIIFKKRSAECKTRALRALAIAVLVLYVGDFFLMPLSDSYGFGISYHKLPFHICTLMGVLAPLAQFNNKIGSVIKPTVVVLSIVPSIMWMCYPGSAIGYPPFSYILIQTFMYHGILFAWGFLSLALGVVKLDIRKCWREFAGLIIILIWASIGNELYDGVQDWFFLENSMFGIPQKLMPAAVVGSVYALCLAIYGIYYAVSAIISKRQQKLTK